MTKLEAKKSLATLSTGTLAKLTGLRHYSDIDAVLNDLLNAIDHIDISDCETWMEVWNRVS